MAEISLKKEVIETTIANINTNVSNLNEHFNSICNQVDMIKGVWVDNIGLFDNITTLLNSIREVNRDYGAFAQTAPRVVPYGRNRFPRYGRNSGELYESRSHIPRRGRNVRQPCRLVCAR